MSFDGSKVTIGPTGKPQVVMFLAHWCPHCQAEVPRIVELAKDGAFEGIDVAAVATGTNADAPNYPPSAWLEREQWPFPVMVDSPEFTAAQAYGLPSYPYFVFADARGQRWSGARSARSRRATCRRSSPRSKPATPSPPESPAPGPRA